MTYLFKACSEKFLLLLSLACVFHILVQNELNPSSLGENSGDYTLVILVQTNDLSDKLLIADVLDGILDMGLLVFRDFDEFADVDSAQAFDQAWVDVVAGGLELSEGKFDIFVVQHVDCDEVRFERLQNIG